MPRKSFPTLTLPTLALPTLALTALLLWPQPGRAANFSFQGTLAEPNAVQLFEFSLSAPTTVTLITLGYAGGVNAAGSVVPNGGFDPMLALFDGAGTLLRGNDDGSSVPDPDTGFSLDSLLQVLLAPGSYTVALTAFANYARGPALSNGFAGDGTFNGRSAAWAFDVLGADSATLPVPKGVPEPAALALFGAGLAGLGLARRRRGF
jgi:hypothetical protein